MGRRRGKLAGTVNIRGGVAWADICRVDADDDFSPIEGTILTTASIINQPSGGGFPVANPRIVIRAIVGGANLGGGGDSLVMYSIAGNPLPFSGASCIVQALLWPTEDGPFHETANIHAFPSSVNADVTGIISLGRSATLEPTFWHQPAQPLAVSEQVSTTPSRMRQIKGFSNAGIDTVYLMLFDTADGVTEVVLGSVPLWTMKVPNGATFSDDFITSTRIFQYGIYWALSSTPDTFTAYLANAFRVDIELFGQQVSR